ncbi:MAG: hypothetical protein HF973_18720 [Chloroflexi bacterium]|nr:hypothetical protein [Chloroflexota bacterium]
MCCFLAVLFFLGPRIAGILFWLFRPVLWNAAFAGWPIIWWIWPILGLIFLPFTTIMYIFVAPGGIVGFDWLWIILAVLIDIAGQGAGGWGNRDRVSGAA